ncbi:MAG: tyrosine-type recombinase/integrase [Armatimonadetes bacterium]|nr:tyrosine-type recombinase/integrase [Armatimonadota bacterium]
MTLQELAEDFLAANQHRLSSNTLRAYGYDLGLLEREFPDMRAEAVTVVHLRAFLQATAELAPSTLARRQATLRSCFAWAYKNDLLPADPTVKLEPVRLPERNPRPLTEAQVEAILAAIPTTQKRNRLLLSLLYETGIRVGEALGILISHVHLNDRDGGYIRVVGKGDCERIVPLIDAPRTVRLLREMLKTLSTVGPLFRGDSRKGGSAAEALDYTTLYYHFERTLESARQKKPAIFPPEPEPITIHRLRHTYATQKLRDGVPLPSVRKLLGHKNLQTTLRYAEIDLETIKQQLVEARKRRR